VIALIVSILAFAASTALAVRQQRISRFGNHLPTMSNMMAEFRSPAFHENHRIVVTLQPPAQPISGFSDLPPQTRAAFIDVVYFYQMMATQIAMGVLDEDTMLSQLRSRIIAVWEAAEPYVLAERASNPYGDRYMLSLLEYYAKRARSLPPDAARATLLRRRTRE
jgi:hypothetical protein